MRFSLAVYAKYSEEGEQYTIEQLRSLAAALAHPSEAPTQTKVEARAVLTNADIEQAAIDAGAQWLVIAHGAIPFGWTFSIDQLRAFLAAIEAAGGTESEKHPAAMGDAERAGWLADKICNGGDYAKEAAAMLQRWPVSAAPPIAFSLRWANDTRINLSTVFDTEAEAKEWADRCGGPVSVVPLFESAAPMAEVVGFIRAVKNFTLAHRSPPACYEADMDAIIAKVESAAPQAAEWQPIATAPKDGTEILTFGGGASRATATRWLPIGPWQHSYNPTHNGGYNRQPGWYWASWSEPVGPIEPSTWTPLPKPPAAIQPQPTGQREGER
jgi:hypothetical protein